MKFIGALSSLVAGIVGFVALCLAGITTTSTLGNKETITNTTGWDLLQQEYGKIENFNFFKVATIIMLVLAGLIILFSIVLFLCQANIIKTKANLNTVNAVLIGLFAITALLSMIGGIMFAKNFQPVEIGSVAKSVTSVGFGLILNFIVAFLSAVVASYSAFSKSGKSKKRK